MQTGGHSHATMWTQSLAAVAPPFEDGAAQLGALTTHIRIRQCVQAYHKFLWRSLRRLGVPEGTAEDIVQQAFITFSRRLSEIDPGKERAFLFGTALRSMANAKRSERRRHEVPLAGEAESRSMAPAVKTPEQLFSEHQARAILDQALSKLPLELRTVFVLFELEELSTREIASTLGLPQGTVASRLRRARQEFQSCAEKLRTELRAFP